VLAERGSAADSRQSVVADGRRRRQREISALTALRRELADHEPRTTVASRVRIFSTVNDGRQVPDATVP